MSIIKTNTFLIGMLAGLGIAFVMFAFSPRANASDFNIEDSIEKSFMNETPEVEINYDFSEAINAEVNDLLGENLEQVEEKSEEVLVPDNITPFEGASAPAPFTDSDISRKLKDGTSQKFDGNKYMIVPRVKEKKKVVTERVEITRTIVKTKSIRKNRITLYGGHGPNDLETNETNTKVKLDKDGLFGLGYSRQITDRVNLDVVGLSNETGMVGIGLNF